jgi:hypothetical protein
MFGTVRHAMAGKRRTRSSPEMRGSKVIVAFMALQRGGWQRIACDGDEQVSPAGDEIFGWHGAAAIGMGIDGGGGGGGRFAPARFA